MASASVQHLVAVVREAMRCEAGLASYAVDWAGIDAAEFVSAVQRHRVAGLLIAHQPQIAMPDPIAEPVRELALAEAHGGLLLTGRTLEVVAIMDGAGIPCLVMKGAALSALTMSRPAARGSGDVDLLVREGDVMATHRALRRAGFVRWAGFELEPGAWWSMTRWLGRELPYRRGGSDVDVHWRVAYDHRLLPPTEHLLIRGQTITIGAEHVRTLSLADSLAAACFHAYFDRYARLRGLLDVLRLTRTPGVALPPDSTPSLRQLVSDTVSFAVSLIGDAHDVSSVRGCAQHVPDPAYARALWDASADQDLWYDEITPVRDFGRLYGHQARYSRPGSSLVRFAAGRALLLQDLDPRAGMPGIASSVATKARSVASNRLRPPR